MNSASSEWVVGERKEILLCPRDDGQLISLINAKSKKGRCIT